MKLFFFAVAALSFSVAACSSFGLDDGRTDSVDEAVRSGGGDDVRPGSHLACNLDSECPSGEECRRHICQVDSRHDAGSSSSSTCPPGYEVEIEHGVTSCKPHGDGSSSSSSSSTSTTACSSDADCPAGLECEIETEHGATTSYCKPHGGGHGGRDDD